MLLYEVNLDVNQSIELEFRSWLEAHVSEIIRLPGFLGATVFEAQAMAPEEQKNLRLCVQYRLQSEAALGAYLQDHAPRFREDGMKRFGGRFTATRRKLIPIREL